jgi:hypothetical protein
MNMCFRRLLNLNPTSSSFTPFSVRTYLIADGNYPIDRCDTVVDVPKRENLFPMKFFYGMPTAKSSVRSR